MIEKMRINMSKNSSPAKSSDKAENLSLFGSFFLNLPPFLLLRMIVSTERRVRSLYSRIVVRATTDTTDQRRQLIQFYSLTKHNLQTTHNPAGATARTAIRLTRATQSPLRTPAGNRLQTSSARVQDFLLNISLTVE